MKRSNLKGRKGTWKTTAQGLPNKPIQLHKNQFSMPLFGALFVNLFLCFIFIFFSMLTKEADSLAATANTSALPTANVPAEAQSLDGDRIDRPRMMKN